MPVERNDFDSTGLKQRKVCDIRTMVRVDENFEVRSELKAVFMQIPSCDRIVTGQSFGKCCIQCDLLLWLGDVYKTGAGKPGDFLRRSSALAG